MSSQAITAPVTERVQRPWLAGIMSHKLDLLLVGIIFFLALWQNLSEIPSTAFFADESRWLNRAYFLRDLEHPLSSAWDDSYVHRVQPPMGNYLMGIALLAQGRSLTTNGPWDYNRNTQWNIDHGNMPSIADRNAGRRANSLLGALTAVVIYFIGKRLTNRAGGLFAALFFAAHPLSRYIFSIALSDALLVFFIALATLQACRLAQRPTWGRAIGLGVLLGLGGATKLTPMLVSVPLALAGLVFLVALRLRWGWLTRLIGSDPEAPETLQRQRRLGWLLLVLPLVAFLTFIAVNPYLWREPVRGTEHIFAFRSEEMVSQGTIWSDLNVGSRTEALRRVGITLGTRFSTSGRFLSKLAHGFGRNWFPQGFDLEMAIVGAELMTVLTIWRGLSSQAGLVAMLLVAEVATIILGMRADFARYHMPILFAFTICTSVLAGEVWRLLTSPVVQSRARDEFYRWLDRLVPGGELAPMPAPSRAASNRFLRQRPPRRHQMPRPGVAASRAFAVASDRQRQRAVSEDGHDRRHRLGLKSQAR